MYGGFIIKIFRFFERATIFRVFQKDRLLGGRVGANDVFYFVRVGIKEGESRSSKPYPFSIFCFKSIHDGHDLSF